MLNTSSDYSVRCCSRRTWPLLEWNQQLPVYLKQENAAGRLLISVVSSHRKTIVQISSAFDYNAATNFSQATKTGVPWTSRDYWIT